MPGSEPPYVRKQRLAPFPESEEYDQSRAEILSLETQGLQMLASGDREKAAWTFLKMRLLDRLDLIKLMSDSDILYDVCKACNEGKKTPHVFPADRTAYARLAEEDSGYPRVF